MIAIAITVAICATVLGAAALARDTLLRWQATRVDADLEARVAKLELGLAKASNRLAEVNVAGGRGR